MLLWHNIVNHNPCTTIFEVRFEHCKAALLIPKRFLNLSIRIPWSMISNAAGPFQGKWNFCWFQGKKSASLLDHISRFLSHQFVTWYLRSISKTKIVKFFCPCMSEHIIYIKNVTNVTQTSHQNVTNVTKQNIASKEILTIEFVLTRTGSTIINQKLVDSMFAPGAVAIQKWNFPLFWSQTWRWNGPALKSSNTSRTTAGPP